MNNNDNDLGYLAAGKKGELLTQEKLKGLNENYIQMHSKRISLGYKSQSTEIDHLVIGKNGIYVIDSKHWSGEIVLLNPGYMQIKPSGETKRSEPDEDLASQLEHQTYVVKQALNKLGMYDIPIYGVMVFTFDGVKVRNDFNDPQFKALVLQELNDYILEVDENGDRTILKTEQDKIYNFLIEKSKDSDAYEQVRKERRNNGNTVRSSSQTYSSSTQTYTPKLKPVSKTRKILTSTIVIAVLAFVALFFYNKQKWPLPVSDEVKEMVEASPFKAHWAEHMGDDTTLFTITDVTSQESSTTFYLYVETEDASGIKVGGHFDPIVVATGNMKEYSYDIPEENVSSKRLLGPYTVEVPLTEIEKITIGTKGFMTDSVFEKK